MTYKKNDIKTIESARKGAIKKNKLYPEQLGQVWKKLNSDKNHQSKSGKKSRIGENKKAEELKSQYDNIFLPQTICDRICIKSGKITFIEIKQIGQKLKPKQQEFKELCDKFGYEYIIEYINFDD